MTDYFDEMLGDAVDECRITHQHRFERGDAYFRDVSKGWSDALRAAFSALPDFRF
jgi:putative proteasome-type protease